MISVVEDFPILKEIVYLDSACMTLRPVQVIKKIEEYYLKYPVCLGRSKHWLSFKLSNEIKESREIVKEFINARLKNEIVFVRNTTEAINNIAKGLKFKKGDVVVISDKEHNSNLIPWIKLKKKKLIKLKVVSTKEGFIDFEEYKKIFEEENVKLVSFVCHSNIDGLNIFEKNVYLKEAIKIAHKNNSLFLLDGAQTIGHEPFDLEEFPVDFLAFSGHKMCGPSGIGVLYGKFNLLEELDPLNSGGSTVSDASFEDYEELKPPYKFEAGLQNYPGIIGLKEAINYLNKIGIQKISKHCKELGRILFDELEGLINERIFVINTKKENVNNIFNFYFDKKNKEKNNKLVEELNNFLSSKKIAIRIGKHCVHAYYNKNNFPYSARASWYFYNNEEEIKLFSSLIKEFIFKNNL